MGAGPLRLDELVESVADGSEVDWDAAEAAADDDQRPIVRNLRVLARISDAGAALSTCDRRKHPSR